MTSANPQHAIAPHERLIVALDTPDPGRAMELVRAMAPAVSMFKVGLQLFLAGGGYDVVRRIGDQGGQVFLDLKLLDIPETVRNALEVIATGHEAVTLTTIHVFNTGLGNVLRAGALSPHLRVLAVTVLTSMNEGDLTGMGGGDSVEATVTALTRRALEMGCHGVIASGREAPQLREEFGAGPLIVTPGIRPAWGAVAGDDQQRAVTPREAILGGADYLVVGRPILRAEDPASAAGRVQEEIAQAFAERDAPGGGAA